MTPSIVNEAEGDFVVVPFRCLETQTPVDRLRSTGVNK